MESNKSLLEKNANELSQKIKTIASLHNITKDLKICIASKYASIEDIQTLHEYGYTIFGENKVQDALKKIDSLQHLKKIQWHFIGHLQKNKVKKVVENFDTIQSVDSIDLLEIINKKCIDLNKKITCFLQINTANDEKKHGFKYETLLEKKEKIFSFSNIHIKGIMLIAPYSEDKKKLKNIFDKTYLLFETLKNEFNISELSMGMSSDFETAIPSGSTMIRIGRTLFQGAKGE
ncbi:YggS family pyridoxal phosphate-dependent enzyme [Candidatus Marinamargulisbacteria bacterium SCGC AG-343-D04]|nr:YggS family pyridoxal phosphate-dependent enzyme [Candidatus Marinamargulisbacteria bacterium SCGC AG-343-D04]